jgi:hypothetical protein
MFTRRQVILGAFGVSATAALAPFLGRNGVGSADAALGPGPRAGGQRFVHRGRDLGLGEFRGQRMATIDGRGLSSHEFFQIRGADGVTRFGSHLRPFDEDDPDAAAVLRRLVDGAADGLYRV